MIRRRWILVAAVLAAQAVCLAAGVIWYAGWQTEAWREALRDQFARSQEHVTEQAVRTVVDRMPDLATLTPSEAAACFQSQISGLSLPAGWDLSIVDHQGGLVADWQRGGGSLPALHPGRWLVVSDGQRRPLLECVPADGSTFCGRVFDDDDGRVAAVRRIARTPYAAIVHRPVDADLASAAMRLPQPAGFSIAFVLLLLTGMITHRIIHRYETRLAVANRGLEHKLFKRTAALVQTRDAVMYGLTRLADSRDRETGAHITRLQHLSTVLAREAAMDYPEISHAWIETLRFASALHDIGKVGIPDAILLKPGRLDDEERLIMQQHPLIGAECLAAIGDRLGDNDFLSMAREIALHHHEWWDGSGYPSGMRGEAIPLAARIVAIADVYDAATSTRIYRAAQSHDDVREMIVALSQRQFDPRLVDAFLLAEPEMRRISEAGQCEDEAERFSLKIARTPEGLPLLSGVN